MSRLGLKRTVTNFSKKDTESKLSLQQRGSVILQRGLNLGIATPNKPKTLSLKKDATNNDIIVLRDQVEQQNLKIERLETVIQSQFDKVLAVLNKNYNSTY